MEFPNWGSSEICGRPELEFPNPKYVGVPNRNSFKMKKYAGAFAGLALLLTLMYCLHLVVDTEEEEPTPRARRERKIGDERLLVSNVVNATVDYEFVA